MILGSIRVNAWREHAEAVAKLFMGEKVMLENVYAKVGYTVGKLSCPRDLLPSLIVS